jgi:phosphoribosylformylglycinamidine cyclo-ligase
MTNLYKQAGVDIDAGQRAVELMKEAVRSTFTPAVLADVGSFGGLFALQGLPEQPVLVASTDGVGTKVKLAAQLGRWQGIGADIVHHCVNDILVQGARPLFFLDYVASSKLVPEQLAAVVTGIAEACKAVGCALLGGETAEMPGVYAEGAFDLVGTVVGIVAREAILPRAQQMKAGDLLIGLPSSGPHTNGYTLIRKLIEGRDLNAPLESKACFDTQRARCEQGQSLADILLAPHRCYLPEVEQLQRAEIPLKGLAHITGGGFMDNIPRILPEGLAAQIDLGSWALPLIFQRLLDWGQIATTEAYRVFNMGIGMVLVVDVAYQRAIQALLPEARLIGTLIETSNSGAYVHLVEN